MATVAPFAESPEEGQAAPADGPLRRALMPSHAVLATVLATVGVLAVWPTALLLWSLWTTDPLKSIGGFAPLLSLVLILRVWRALRWEARGSWWGLAVLAGTVAVVRLRDGAVLELILSPSWSITLPPHALVAFAYASGVVLLAGGGRLWRAAWFPVALMTLVNPVPHILNRFADLPLQHASASVARSLAHALGQHLTPDQLYLMFTPDFGMFIAPGCNGMRGSVTMGLMALVAGYLYRFRWRVWASVVVGAVALGYVFNLVRLCVLVLYYVLALRLPFLQGHAEMGDYCLGAGLFFLAAMLLFAAIRRFNPGGDLRVPALALSADLPAESPAVPAAWGRLGAMAVLLAVGSVPYARGLFGRGGRAGGFSAESVRFPEAVGAYRVRRTWPERLNTGQTIFEWAEYAIPGAGHPVAVGVSPVLGAHDTLLCHAARGEDWLWHGPLQLDSPAGPVSFSASFFSDDGVVSLEATTLCTAAGCGQWTSGQRHFGLVWSRPGPLGTGSSRPVPVLLRVESVDEAVPAEQGRAQLTGELRAFLANVSPKVFALPVREP